MSPAQGAEAVEGSVVAAALEPSRAGLADGFREFTLALLALAKADVKAAGGFNGASPKDSAALKALAHWRSDAHQALVRVRSVTADAPGKKLAERWLKTLIAALDLQRQALSLIDPARAAHAAQLARQRVAESHRLEARLDRVIL
jgi:hypothetical protein